MKTFEAWSFKNFSSKGKNYEKLFQGYVEAVRYYNELMGRLI